MAEALGAVASGISVAQLAGNITSSIIKLKNYWDQIQDAPDDIAFLVRELDTHHFVLRSILESQAKFTSARQPMNSFLDHSLKLSHDSFEELNNIVGTLAKEINSNCRWKKKLGATKVVLKGEQLKKLKRRMKTATRLMNLAISWQTNATLQQQSFILAERVQASLKQTFSSWQSSIPSTTVNVAAVGVEPSLLDCMKRSSYLSPLQNAKAKSRDPPICGLNRHTPAEFSDWYHEPTWVQQMLSNHAGFVNDRFYEKPITSSVKESDAVTTYLSCEGLTPLHIAASRGDIDLCKLLLSEGADVSSCDESDEMETPLSLIAQASALMSVRLKSEPIDLIRTLLEAGADMELVDDTRILANTYGPGSVFDLLRNQTILSSGEMTFTEKIQIASGKLAYCSWSHAPSLIISFLGGPEFQANIALRINDEHMIEAFHTWSRNFAILNMNNFCSVGFDSELKPWVSLLQEVISAGIGMHSLNGSGCTPLHTMIQASTSRRRSHISGIGSYRAKIDYALEDKSFAHAKHTLMRWLELLKGSGIDLRMYGEQEFLHNRTWQKSQNFYDEPWWRDDSEWPLLSFKYGSCVEDWEFWFLDATDGFVGDFWSLVEDPTTTSMPGSWVE
ncbi:hypothetical protein EYC80_010139 [Monilinia laxa]|uniref:Uncharacterized protein n=1 Tax=Monilinia laxa TaxID=61186 RepID=A0A5N6JLZ2_MONLA|nr:hypothetical protein EYC80_010139 [Monilinia laxa]